MDETIRGVESRAGAGFIGQAPRRKGGGRRQCLATDSGERQRSPIFGIEFGKLADVANLWHWIRETGNGCQSVALDSGNWQALPVSRFRCQFVANDSGD
jgi:hypothetical protein